MAGINKVILVGNLGKDPEVRHLEGGASVAHFTLATNEYYKDKQGNRVERTEWHNIAAWRGLAEMAEKFLKKGQQVYVEGKIRTRQYQDKDNQTRYITEIIADEITMLGGRPNAGNGQNAAATNSTEAEAPQTFRQEPELDQLPF
ncbi:single-stranded DNA-binding protein [Hymenobacter sp. BT186]|uniref:Single-stranded DNA-binding protein n=1 Tax=Hymenobacter telluris TaxID=2816474 RepID=A0A939JDY2_9BACT|nr:single-stranded DNA-binding protein [Hymenobacter telluris]MBO0359875.1 single-stranded DNA-binding protein [Hymenobacter telluris]MBW3375902.1 single-stranded DNA-binding protein [Hymenobacter norwichensis]